jgi:glycerol-3-phosphate acyltransferase PlsY
MTDVTRRLEPLHVADWLALAAAPTFALMAVLTGILDSGAHQTACSAAMHMSPLTGMLPMYVLMSGFHFTPWLKLICRLAKRRRGRLQRVALCTA